MRVYMILLIQFLIWSSYTVALWVSKQDGIKSKLILFIVFSYLAYWVATSMGLSKRNASFATIISLAIFFTSRQLFWITI
ncbi:hypothetical protein PY093_01335 [Cytobacillus sp. S13-E01]|uniref:hypothetical protein n=1 Tax=Cytobacillus sp. S13-E01 TaxID=3031326 RepID=UPI0023D82EA5|nr:hypothetical protein [Cytobacillus sp. S13-E01]MDF0725350.1 hypothetical protein [Cytobacillus sp. S13-E01]